MEAQQILQGLAALEPLPVAAIRAAQADRAAMVPIFLEAIERFLPAGGDQNAANALFYIFHLLGEWRETAAYRPLAGLLRSAPDSLSRIFADTDTETSHRVMAAVFDGDPAPLYEIICDADADEYIRSRMLEALAMATLRGELPREEANRFLHACYSELQPQDECWVWIGWQSAIAALGLTDLVPLVEQVFAREFISPGWMSVEHFRKDLRRGIENPAEPFDPGGGEFTLFGDTVEELSTWPCFQPENPMEGEDWEAPHGARALQHTVLHHASSGPAFNPHRDVGRNDPCPCGSGKKFKRCCLPSLSIPLSAA